MVGRFRKGVIDFSAKGQMVVIFLDNLFQFSCFSFG